jgi:hypothetical protein
MGTGAEALRHSLPAMTRHATAAAQRKQALRHDIMNVVKANGFEVTGDFWFMLIFRTESELKKIAQELHVKAA